MEFYNEIQNLRKQLPANLKTESLLRQQEERDRLAFKTRLLNMEEDAIDQYYQQYKNLLRKAASRNQHIFLPYIFGDGFESPQQYEQVHQMIIEKFNQDGIEAIQSGGVCMPRGFSFRNIK